METFTLYRVKTLNFSPLALPEEFSILSSLHCLLVFRHHEPLHHQLHVVGELRLNLFEGCLQNSFGQIILFFLLLGQLQVVEPALEFPWVRDGCSMETPGIK